MRHRRTILLAALLLLCAVAAVFGAGALLPHGADSAKAADAVVLTIKHAGTTVKQYTLADLKAVTPYQGYAGFMTSGLTVHGPDPITGVSLVAVLHDAGLDLAAGQSLNLLASDGYTANLSYDQVVNATGFDMFNATTTQAEAPAAALTPVLVYERNGVALDPFDPQTGSGEGPLRLFVAQPTDVNQVMEGSVSVSGVAALDVLDQPITEWDLKLVGLKIHGTRQTITENRNAMDGCATPNCHKSAWTDAGDHAWTGVPLWRLMGVVDGGNRHLGNSYNAALARKGYRIRLFDAAGNYRTISSRVTPFRNTIVLATERDGVVLGAGLYPLRLVGPAKYVPVSRRLGGIVKIKMLPW